MSAKIDLSLLSIPELQALVREAEAEIKKREKEERAALLASFEQQAKEKGFSLADLLGPEVVGSHGSKKKGGKQPVSAPVKYRNPENAAETWTGKGRMPAWVKARKDAGKDLEACLVEKAA